jgi:hypothetical protein
LLAGIGSHEILENVGQVLSQVLTTTLQGLRRGGSAMLPNGVKAA